jgi:multicomponent Na+:H+ antiporter subunit C
MTWIAAIIAAVLAGAGAHLMMRRHLLDVIIGVSLLSQAVNVVILASGGWVRGNRPPVLLEEAAEVEVAGALAKVSQVDASLYQDPLPQALILTAIVIGFALLSFLMVLAARAHEETGSGDVGELESEDSPT